MSGAILTFYSYKGGTGRSMTVANTAWILAASGLRVLAVDWDLEAPGLHRYFQPFLADPNLSGSPGVIDLVWRFAEATIDTETPDEPGWHDELANISPYAMSIEHDFPDAGTIDFVPAGRQDATYSALVSQFDWNNFYDRLGGGGFLEAMKRNMRSRYDYVLIDSRTGLSDTAGICTVQLPDILVNCFSLSNQAIHGADAVARSVNRQRQHGDLRIFPVPMRVEDGEQDKLESSRDYARALFGRYLTHVPDPERYWGEVEVPYKSFYAYEEILATVGDRPRQENTVLAATERIVGYLTDGRVTELAAVTAESDRRALLARFQRTGSTESIVNSPVAGPRVFISYAFESAEQFETVRELWYLLRAGGIDARLDLPPGQRRDDWPAWLRAELNLADLVLVVASATAQETSTEMLPSRKLGVVLPGTSPVELLLDEHVVIKEVTAAGVEPLRRRVLSLVKPGSATSSPRYPLPHNLTGSEESLRRLASTVRMQWHAVTVVRRLSDPSPMPIPWRATKRPVASTASQPSRMSGNSAHLGDLFLRLPRARLVVLGAPGSGKTTAMIMLVLDLLAARPELGAVPVLLPATSWDLSADSFDDWIVRRVAEDYPTLRNAAARLVEARAIIPVLDGLDELPAEQRRLALYNIALVDDLPVIVTCRTTEYEATVDTTGLILPEAAVVELAPMPVDSVVGYLTEAQPISDKRWKPVLAAVEKSPRRPLARVLSSPLMVDLARSAYAAGNTNPTELLAFSTTEDVEEHLLHSFVSAKYEHPAPSERLGRWRSVDSGPVRRWLAQLARSMGDSRDLRWWQVRQLVPAGTIRVVLGVAGFLFTALVGGVQTLLHGEPAWPAVVGAGVVSGVLGAGWSGRIRTPYRLSTRSPQQTLRRDILASLWVIVVNVAVVGAATGILVLNNVPPPRAIGVSSIVVAFLVVLIVSGSAWGQFAAARFVLARRGRLPLRLMSFLDDAHRRGVLRQVGPVYQFRHAALQRHLARGKGLDDGRSPGA